MKKAKPGKAIPRGGVTTRYVGKTKLEKENEEVLKRIRAIKGGFG